MNGRSGLTIGALDKREVFWDQGTATRPQVCRRGATHGLSRFRAEYPAHLLPELCFAAALTRATDSAPEQASSMI